MPVFPSAEWLQRGRRPGDDATRPTASSAASTRSSASRSATASSPDLRRVRHPRHARDRRGRAARPRLLPGDGAGALAGDARETSSEKGDAGRDYTLNTLDLKLPDGLAIERHGRRLSHGQVLPLQPEPAALLRPLGADRHDLRPARACRPSIARRGRLSLARLQCPRRQLSCVALCAAPRCLRPRKVHRL